MQVLTPAYRKYTSKKYYCKLVCGDNLLVTAAYN